MSLFRSGSRHDGPDKVTDRVLTVPNVLSGARLAILPLLYADLAAGRALRALVVLAAVAASDWIDGFVARRFDQVSRLGQLIDPISDRVVVAVVGVGLLFGEILPLWAVLAVVGRDAVLLIGAAALVVLGIRPPEVSDLGKAATFGLMGALTSFLLAEVVDSGQLLASAWVLFGSSAVLYYLAGAQYVAAAIHLLRARADR